MKVKFKNIKNGEIIEVNLSDFDKYTECMTNGDYLLIF